MCEPSEWIITLWDIENNLSHIIFFLDLTFNLVVILINLFNNVRIKDALTFLNHCTSYSLNSSQFPLI